MRAAVPVDLAPHSSHLPHATAFPAHFHRFVFHGVHMMLQFGSSREGLGKPWQPGEKRYNRVVFIGALCCTHAAAVLCCAVLQRAAVGLLLGLLPGLCMVWGRVA